MITYTAETKAKAKLSKRRPVRSFVIRGRSLTPRQQHAMQHHAKDYLLDLAAESAAENKQKLLQPAKIFTQTQPLVLEIGFGMGKSLVEDACQYPHWNFLGIEVHPPGVASAIADAKQHHCTNLKIISADACEVLRHHLPDRSCDKIQILCPDPWPKAKHHKRRILQQDFLKLLHTKLKHSAILYITTDHAGYADWIGQQLDACAIFNNIKLENIAPCNNSLHPGQQNKVGALQQQLLDSCQRSKLTKYQQRGQRLGHNLYHFICSLRT